ncbi:hypothetical protein HMPREF9714_03624 [Myroides odoratimimus CCUG 12901]|uniref:DUF8202 domain-containing protein n=1 Tax=Myroides odoratimimus CCUG 10230 TaxID=883150 RepID=A0ABN0EF78_9FLAO|nr:MULTISPECIES: hypothetical protein [Myroides]EHO04759.1 hypothetical protein HMPREF9714_03624 [Myroides odoratimimus CCUG 12901]EHO12860.1 hypothetical protein HMPREF9712_00007 [Myroides odoratimimus CCUG 10230]MDM1519261.1 hypothetical protein [Myroides odoratimimus]STZ47897.1 Uncharacterised protein [Myroides odoratimimus]GAQ15360.1 hypothetical protein MODO_3056 [Myroides odoratimimus]
MYRYLYKILALLFLGLTSMPLFAQREYPGGVGNVQLWLKPDNRVKMYSSTEVDEWANAPVTTDSHLNMTFSAVSQAGKQRPTLLKGSYKMNFNNALVFNGSQFLATPLGISGFVDGLTVFGVYIAEKGKNEKRMYYMGFGSTDPSSKSTRRPSIGFSPKETGGRVRLTSARDGHGGYEINTTALQTTYVPEGATNYVTFRFSGTEYSLDSKGNKLTGAAKGALKPDEGVIIGGASLTSGFFMGQIGEIIVYNRKLNGAETSKIESYLATKYGITLDNAAYMSSYGSVFWPWGRTGLGYHNNVAGIFRDDANTSISVSRSTASGAALTVNTIGTEFEVGLGVIQEEPLNRDNAAIYWGTNIGQGYTSTKVNDHGCGYSEILDDKFWLFRKTNLGSTIVEVRAGGEDFPYSGQGYDVKMLVAKTEADARNQNWLAVIPGQYIGGELDEHLFRLPINRDELYITFGADAAVAQCNACTTNETGLFNFSSRQWTAGLKSMSNLTVSNGLRFDVTYKTYSNGKETPSMQASKYPRVSNGTLLESKFRGVRGSDDNYSITNITFKDGATFAKFKIYGIDKTSTSTDMVEVIGYCGNTTYRGVISSSSNSSKKTFSVGGGIVTGLKRSSISNKNGAAVVTFPHEVTRIEIKHKIHYRTKSRGYQGIAIGDFELNCPRPASPNPDGIEFTLQAPAKVVSCSGFEYTFKVWNYSCEPRYVKIEDELPEGMFWVDGGLMSTEGAFNDAIFNNYEGTRKLEIDKVKLDPMTFTTITARVRFKDDAVAKVYENRGQLTYTSLNENKVLTIESCDYNNFTSCTSTKVEMIYQPRVLSPEISIEPVLNKCYKENGIITIKAKVKNPNPTVTFADLRIMFMYHEDFRFNKFQSNLGQGMIESEEGMHIVEGLNINGGSTLELTYELQALDFLAIIEAATGNKYTKPSEVPDADIAQVVDFGASIELIGNSEDVCINSSLDDAYTVLDPTIPFCGGSLICYYPGVEGSIVKKNADFVIMTSLDRSNGELLAEDGINAILYLESKSKGFVLTRLTDTQIKAFSNPIAGMMVYDTTNKCMKLYNGKIWACIVQSCPDN